MIVPMMIIDLIVLYALHIHSLGGIILVTALLFFGDFIIIGVFALISELIKRSRQN